MKIPFASEILVCLWIFFLKLFYLENWHFMTAQILQILLKCRLYLNTCTRNNLEVETKNNGPVWIQFTIISRNFVLVICLPIYMVSIYKHRHEVMKTVCTVNIKPSVPACVCQVIDWSFQQIDKLKINHNLKQLRLIVD